MIEPHLDATELDMRVLLAEDEKKVAGFIRKALREAGFTVDMVHRGDEALQLARTTPYDVIVLDVMMPGRDGLSVLRQLRTERVHSPVLFVTARTEPAERIEGLDAGADDYLAKPFDMGELCARVRALTRRTGERNNVLRVADLSLNLLTRQVERLGKPIEMQAREFALLEFFMRTPGRVLSRTQIIEHVWDHHFDTGTNVVDVYIQRLRRKIDDGYDLKLLHTVRGIGYVLKAES
ncbi:response regulator transcription factor [Verrucomicrobiota bacterium sgz303538]